MVNKSHSLRSASSSISYASSSSSEMRTVPPHARPSSARPLSPRIEEEVGDDKGSVKSLRMGFSPRRSFRNLLSRRANTQVDEMVDLDGPPAKVSRWNAPTTWDGRPATPTSPKRPMRKPSLPKLTTAFSQPRAPNAHMYSAKPLPATPYSAKPPSTPFTPMPKVDELRCQPCYYYAARHCNGYVFGGSHGDACENCLVRCTPNYISCFNTLTLSTRLRASSEHHDGTSSLATRHESCRNNE